MKTNGKKKKKKSQTQMRNALACGSFGKTRPNISGRSIPTGSKSIMPLSAASIKAFSALGRSSAKICKKSLSTNGTNKEKLKKQVLLCHGRVPKAYYCTIKRN